MLVPHKNKIQVQKSRIIHLVFQAQKKVNLQKKKVTLTLKPKSYNTQRPLEEETSSDESLLDVLKPFDFESVCSPRKDLIIKSQQSSEDGEQVRKGNTDWCLCGCCKVMETEAESFCCRDTNKVPDFEGHKCITEFDGFKMVRLAKPVLKTALSALNHFRGDSLETVDNESFRFSGYKQYIFWIYNYLGKGIQKDVSSCSVWKIRDKFKSVSGIYIPFSESKDDM